MRKLITPYIGYAGFLVSGFAIFIVIVTNYLPLDNGQVGVFGFLILIPLSMVGLVGILTGIICALLYYREFWLNILSIISLLLLVELVWELGGSLFYNSVIVLYGLAAILVPVKWFIEKKKSA